MTDAALLALVECMCEAGGEGNRGCPTELQDTGGGCPAVCHTAASCTIEGAPNHHTAAPARADGTPIATTAATGTQAYPSAAVPYHAIAHVADHTTAGTTTTGRTTGTLGLWSLGIASTLVTHTGLAAVLRHARLELQQVEVYSHIKDVSQYHTL